MEFGPGSPVEEKAAAVMVETVAFCRAARTSWIAPSCPPALPVAAGDCVDAAVGPVPFPVGSRSGPARRRRTAARQFPVLIRPLVRREAVYSRCIDGSQATLGELLAAEAGVTPERSPKDLREVSNDVAALEPGMKWLKQLPHSLRVVRELHEKLMTGVRADRAAPGDETGPRENSPRRRSSRSPPACIGGIRSRSERTPVGREWRSGLHPAGDNPEKSARNDGEGKHGVRAERSASLRKLIFAHG